MQEIWKPIKGYEGLYEVSNFGRVKNKNTNKILKPIDSHGYKYVHLCNKHHIRKNQAIHRLVALHFINIDKDKIQVNHKDGNKSNNCINNLEWCSSRDNSLHKVNYLKKGIKKVKCIETGQIFDSIKDAAEFYDKNQSTLVAVLNHYKYNHTFAKYHWEYVL